ncbi:MAG: MerR family transcriptional regulator [Bacteroidetes bacterium]|nr:MAG: MerR family transcriptional regulator [Bacteroidota bacterium]
MSDEDLIPTKQFCESHNLEITFISSLQQYGMIQTTSIEEVSYISIEQLPRVEKIVRLYTELGINIEGIDAIEHLLDRVEAMQNEILHLKNQLKMHEGS